MWDFEIPIRIRHSCGAWFGRLNDDDLCPAGADASSLLLVDCVELPPKLVFTNLSVTIATQKCKGQH